MNTYLEARFSPAPAPIITDLLTAGLAEIGFESFTEDEEGFSAYIPEDDFHEADFEQVISQIPDLPQPIWINHPPENWNAVWESQFEPIALNRNCWIRAPFHAEIPHAGMELLIEPKMSFGTGHHATTRLMCNLMLEQDFTGKAVWDYGCGTGVLGILAAKLGATRVIANDIETWAVENAQENAERNGVHLYLFTGGAELLPSGESFDIILANINRNILSDTAAHYLPHLRPDGLLFLSGFLNQDEAFLSDLMQKNGLSLLEVRTEGGWSCLLFRKIPG